MSQKLQAPRGTQDLYFENAAQFRLIEQTGLDVGKNFGYSEIRTPIFEFSEVFHRTLGETSDIVHKETYTFLDRGGDSITLRPEGTAGIARAFISEGLAQNLPLKFYYAGPMFRHERPQKGRFRQFHQVGAEALGFENPLCDVETLSYAYQFLNQLGLGTRCRLEINSLGDLESRRSFREALAQYLEKYRSELSPDSQLRLDKNPLRILDSKSESDQKILSSSPKFESFLSKDSQKYFDRVLNGLEVLSIPFVLQPSLVRGLDYYSHTVFEFITSELGAQGAVLGGGRYDGLIEMMGGPKTPGVGWAAGVERLVELAQKNLVLEKRTRLGLAPADELGELHVLKIQSLLSKKISVEILWNGNLGKKLKKADQLKLDYCLVVGQREIETKTYEIKFMTSGQKKELTESELLELNWLIPIPVTK